MDNAQEKKHGFWRKGWWALIVLGLAVGWACNQPVVWDYMRGWGYTPDSAMQEIEEALELTEKGRRIFAATQPVVEEAEAFNGHCGQYDGDVSVLGCYSGGKIYVYKITDQQLVLANKVTAAHELLHAIWERLDEQELEQVKGWLEEVQNENTEWIEQELALYNDEDKTEEIYTRAGTKLRDLPEGLEKHYAEYFKNREQIVAMYETYEAPFAQLKKEIDELYAVIEAARAEIELERQEYNQAVDGLDARIDSFNACAGQEGCFSAAEFESQRAELVAERDRLEEVREMLNAKIDINNARIQQHYEKQAALGGLYSQMNSNMEHIESSEEI